MTDNDVSISRYHPWVRMMLWACLVIMIGSFVTYTIVRLRTTYVNERQVTELIAKHEQHKKDCEASTRDLTKQVEELHIVVFGEVTPKLRQRSVVPSEGGRVGSNESWVMNNFKELKARVRRLERVLLFDYYEPTK